MTTTHKFDQCSPTSSSVVIILMVLTSPNTAGSHPGTALSSAWAEVASAIDKANESTARLAIRQIFIFVCIIPTRYIYNSQPIVHWLAMSIVPASGDWKLLLQGLLQSVSLKKCARDTREVRSRVQARWRNPRNQRTASGTCI